MQSVANLGMQQAAPSKAGSVRQQSGAAEQPSFRSSMEQAGQESAASAVQEQNTDAAQAEEPDAIPQAPQLQEGQMESVAEEAAGSGMEAGKLEELIALLQGNASKKPGEDIPAEDQTEDQGAQTASLAALLLQSLSQANQPHEAAQEIAAGQPGQEGVQVVRINPWQNVAPQDGEQEAVQPGEAAAEEALNLKIGNILKGAEQSTDAMMAQAGQPQTREQQDMPAGKANFAQIGQTQVYGPAQQQAAVVDLTAPDAPDIPALHAGSTLQDSLLEQIQSAVRTDKQELFVQLKPESLGGLVIHLSMTEEGLKAQIRTGSENIQNLMTAQISQLEDALRAREIPVVQMDIIYDQTANGSFLNQHRQAWQEQSERGRGPMLSSIEETAGLYEAALAAAAPGELAPEEGVIYSA